MCFAGCRQRRSNHRAAAAEQPPNNGHKEEREAQARYKKHDASSLLGRTKTARDAASLKAEVGFAESGSGRPTVGRSNIVPEPLVWIANFIHPNTAATVGLFCGFQLSGVPGAAAGALGAWVVFNLLRGGEVLVI